VALAALQHNRAARYRHQAAWALADTQITALDWQAVLAVARENADAAGVSGRYHTSGGVRSTLIGAAGSIW